MDITRRGIISSSVLLLAGCTGQDPGSSPQASTETESSNPQYSVTSSVECDPERVDGRTDRTEFAVSVYEESYEGLRTGQKAIGAMMSSEGLFINKEEGVDANVPDGLIIEKKEGGDVLLTLVDHSGSALSDMRNSRFYDALEGFRGAQESLKANIDGDDSTALERRNPGGWNYAKRFIEKCSIENGDLFPKPINDGISTAEHLKLAAEKFAEECKVYLDNDANFEQDLQEANDIQQEAISELQLAANNYPKSPESLRNEVLVYRG